MNDDTLKAWLKIVSAPRREGVSYPCPCCGYPTLSERGGYDICELCNWVDDGQDDPHADEVWGGPNYQYSLTEARENFRQYHIMYNPNQPAQRIGGPSNNPTEEVAKKAIIAAYDALRNETEAARVSEWQVRLEDGKAVLRSELERTIKEYSERKRKADEQ